jgi:sulfur carrier protein
MKIIINGEQREIIEQINLAELLKLLEMPAERIAVELNGEVVRRAVWRKIEIKENDCLEIVHFVGGGSRIYHLKSEISARGQSEIQNLKFSKYE